MREEAPFPVLRMLGWVLSAIGVMLIGLGGLCGMGIFYFDSVGDVAPEMWWMLVAFLTSAAGTLIAGHRLRRKPPR